MIRPASFCVLQRTNRKLGLPLFFQHLSHQDIGPGGRRIQPNRALQKTLSFIEFLHARVGISQLVVGRCMPRVDHQFLLKFCD